MSHKFNYMDRWLPFARFVSQRYCFDKWIFGMSKGMAEIELHVGLMFWGMQPDKNFPYTQIVVVQFPSGLDGSFL